MHLSNAIAEDIRKRRLKAGDPLPGTRVLAQQLRIHRNTAIAGYQELIAQGLVSARSGGGTFVAAPVVPPLAAAGHTGLRSGRPTFAVASPIPPVPMTPPDPGGPLTLVRAIPDVRLLPAEALSRAFRRAISRHGRKLLGYADPRGHPLLRRGLATMLSHAWNPTSQDELVVTRGSQRAIYLIAQALLSPGTWSRSRSWETRWSGARSGCPGPSWNPCRWTRTG
jgi:GntR family transcriptional regulator/MocR family aminotransferase